MDIIWGYNNIHIKEGHEWKAAFLPPKGLFKPTVMYFGLCNLPGTFMCMMQTIFHDMIQQWKCAIYMDNLIFKGKTKEELCWNTLEGLEILQNMISTLKSPSVIGKLKKSQFWVILLAKDNLEWKLQKLKLFWNGKCQKIERMSRSSMGSATFITDMYKDIWK